MIFRRSVHFSIYRTDLDVVICPYSELRGYLDRRFGKDEYAITRVSNGKTWFDGVDFLVWFPATPTLATMVHEACHVSLRMMLSHGVEYSVETEEAYCYALDAVATAVFTIVEQWNRLRRDRKGRRHRERHTHKKAQAGGGAGRHKGSRRRAGRRV